MSLEERVSSEVVRGVREGQADFGVCWDVGDLGGLKSETYRTDHIGIAVRPDHPLAGRERLAFVEALEHEFVDIQAGSMMHTMLQRFAAIAGQSLRFRVRVPTIDAAMRIVAANLGIAVVPREVVGPLASTLGLHLLPLTDDWARRHFVICTRSDVALSATARLLVSFLRERAGTVTP